MPLAMAGVTVYANDLNPRSYHYLKINAAKNHCGDLLKPYNMDGRDFVPLLISKGIHFTHALMNLPNDAITFVGTPGVAVVAVAVVL